MISEEGEMVLAKSLANNLSLTLIYLDSNFLLDDVTFFSAICERNRAGVFHKVCKLMVVGDARMGKTSLVRSLNNQPFNQDESITNVVEICGINFPGSDATMKFFDFGGQEIFNFIHPLFLRSHQCIVILVVNEFVQSLARIKEQIEFLRSFHQKEILVVSTSFMEVETENRISREDQLSQLSTDQISQLGLKKNRFLRISNKEQTGIDAVKREIVEITTLKTIGWTLCDRCDCLRKYFGSIENKLPIIRSFSADYLDIECEHDHDGDNTLFDLAILNTSGWIFTFKDSTTVFTGEKLIVKMFQGLFTINNYVNVSLIKNGLITEEAFENYYRSLLLYSDFEIPPDELEQMVASWESGLDFMCSFSICHKIVTRSVEEGLVPSILFPSLLPVYQLARTKAKWQQLNSICQSYKKQIIARKFTTSSKYDKRKLMDYIFPRLIIKLWNEVLDVELCSSDKFVVRGDNNTADFTLQLKKLNNFMIVERQENNIFITCFGNCCGIVFQLEGELVGLFQEFRNCYNIIKTKGMDYYLDCICPLCKTTLPPLTLDVSTFDQIYQWLEKQHECETCKGKSSAMERINNPSDLLRMYFF